VAINVIPVIHILHVLSTQKIFVEYLMIVETSFNVCTWHSMNYCDRPKIRDLFFASLSLSFKFSSISHTSVSLSLFLFQNTFTHLRFQCSNLFLNKTKLQSSKSWSSGAVPNICIVYLCFSVFSSLHDIYANSDCDDKRKKANQIPFLVFESRHLCLPLLFFLFL